MSVLFDKDKEPKLKYKDAPIDQGKEYSNTYTITEYFCRGE